MRKREESLLLRETALAARQPRLIFQILIFFPVFFVAQSMVDLISGIPTAIWTVQEVLPLALAGETMDMADVMGLISRMPPWLNFVSLVAAGAQIIAAVLYCRCIERRSLRSLGVSRQSFAGEYLKGFAIGALLILLAGGVCAFFGGMEFRLSPRISWGMLLLFLLGFVLQGAGEEFLCRGYFMLSLTNRVSRAWAVVISSTAFGLLHIGNSGITVLALLNLILTGIFLGLYMLRRDDIWGVCGIHSAWNYVQGNILGVEVSGMNMGATVWQAQTLPGMDWLHGGSFGLEGGLAVTAVILAAILLTLFLPRKKES